jgi:hypothetical protein
MLFACRVGEVRIFSTVECEAKAALKTAEMVSQDVRVVGEVSSFILKHPDTFLAELL